MKKGITMTATMLATVVFLVIGLMIIFLIYLSVTRDAPSPISDLFFRLFDFASGV